MWILKWKKYPASKTATVLSIVGTIMRYVGMVCLIDVILTLMNVLDTDYSIVKLAAIIVIGVTFHFLAEKINSGAERELD